MRGWQVVERGHVRIGDDLPEPGLDTIDDVRRATVVEVHRAAANFADRLLIDGRYQLRPRHPFVPGFEAAGVVVATRSSRFAPGDRVVGVTLPEHGSWAQRCVADARHLAAVPDDVGWESAIGLFTNGQTAWFALHHTARVAAGEVVLVHAAAGGVGSQAVQLAAAAGCTVVGTASGAKLDRVRELGAHLAVDNRSNGWPDEIRRRYGEVDVVIDPVGNAVFDGSWRLLGFEGRYVVVGLASGEPALVPTNQALVRNISVHGMYWTPTAERHPELVERATHEIFDLHRAGRLDPCVTIVAPLDEAPERLADVTAGRTVGKTVLRVRADRAG